MTARKVLFWIHLSAGCVAGIVILTLSVTGAMLAFERQITEWSDRTCVPPSGERLPMGELVQRARDAAGDSPTLIRLRSDRCAPVEFSFAREDQAAALDPYSGDVLRLGASRLQRLFATVEHVHRWLAMEGPWRDWGRNITGAANLVFLLLVVSGPFLWWPKSADWTRLKRTLFFQRGLSGRARNFNWHNVAGIWCFLPLLVVVVSGVVMSYAWANNLLYRATGNEPPPPQSRSASGARADRTTAPGGGDSGTDSVNLAALDVLFQKAEQQVPGWERISARLPRARGPMVFSIETGSGGRPDQRSQLALDPDSGEVVRWETFSSYNAGRRLRSWLRFLHTGEALGWPGQTIAAIVSGAAALLSWTGLSLVLQRFRNWRYQKR